MKAKLRRVLAMVMATLMILSCMPLTAMAEIIEASGAVQPGVALFTIDDGSSYKYITYTFKNGDDTVSTQIVKNDDTLYAPASPEKDGYKFLGWYDGDTAFTGFGVQAGISKTKDVTLTAKFAEVHYVFFMDKEGRVYATKEGIKDDVIAADVTFPVSAEEGITGWYTEASLTNKVNSVTLETQNVTLWPKVETGHWITFDSNDGSYIEPVFVLPGKTTAKPAEPTRPGYTFAGWYNGESEFAFGGELTDSVILTAKWTANTNTPYTVIHWWQNANDNGYTFHEAETKTGTTGQQTNATGKKYNTSGTDLFGNKTTDQVFTAQTIEQKTIDGNGSTIVNVYYARKEYTLKFKENEYSYKNIYTITKRWGADITKEEWPTNKNGGSNWQIISGWNVKSLAYTSTMPMGGGKLWKPGEASDNISATYYVESLKQDGSEGTYNKTAKKYFEVHHKDEIKGGTGWTIGDEDRYPINGFTLIPDSPSTSTGETYNGAEFYYSRNKYKIVYYNVTGVDKEVSYRYEESIAGAGDYRPEKPDSIPSAYEFKGWFADAACTVAYNFNRTMPAENVTVYAKWAAPEVSGKAYLRIEGVDFQEIEVSYGETIDESTLPEIDVPKGYAWRGWCIRTGTEGDYVYTPFNFNTRIYSDIELYPYYTSTQSFGVSYLLNGGTGTAPTDSRKYAEGSYADIQAPTGVTAPEGQVFLYWNTQADGSGTSYYPGDKMSIPAANVELYAIYGSQAAAVTLTYHSDFDTDVTKAYNTLQNNEQVTVLAYSETGLPERDGYECIGWATESKATTPKFYADTKVRVDNIGSNDLYAVWKKNKYTVTYNKGDHGNLADQNADGNVVHSNLYYGEKTPGEPTVTADTGWYFTGWRPLIEATVTADKTYVAQYAQKTNLSFVVKDSTKTYNGQTQTGVSITANEDFSNVNNDRVTVSGLKDGHKVVVTSYTPAQGKDASTTPYSGSAPKVMVVDASNTDVTEQYTVTTTVGRLTINPVAIELKANDASKEYDGTPLTDSGYTITKGAFVGEEGLESVTVKGSQLIEGSHDNEITGHTLKANTKAENYTISYEKGTLTVKARTEKYAIEVEANSGSKTYDGTELTVSGFKTLNFTVNGQSYTVSGLDASRSGTNVSDSGVVEVKGKAVVKDASGNDVTAQFVVSTKNGQLTINPKAVMITTPSATKEYDKEALTVEGSIEGIVEGETYNFITTGTQTRVGYSKNTYELTLAGEDNEYTAKASNYVFTESIGTLTVTGDPVIPEKTTPEADGIYQLGDWIPFIISVQNVTDGELTDITVADPTAQIVAGDGYTLVDGVAVIAKLDSGATVIVNAQHQVTEADILSGTYGNTATVTVDDKKFYPSAKTKQLDKPDGKLTVTKETTSEPANGATYGLGETITYQITVKNEGNVTISGIVVTDELTGDEWEIESLKPGETSTEYTAKYVVTEDDILNRKVENMATAIGKTPEGKDPEVKPGKTTDETDEPDGKLTVTKETTSEPANGTTYGLGETITYQITVKNEGNVTISGIVVTDELTGDEWEIESLQPGETSTEYTAKYVVTEDDILNRKVENMATAIGKTPEGEDPEVKPGEATDETDEPNGKLTVTKETTSTPANGATYGLGETITYQITVKNEGNVTISGIVVTDELTGDEWEIESLKPGETSTVYTAEHVVTEADILKGEVVNVATATGKMPEDKDPEVKPGEDREPTVTPESSMTVNKTLTNLPAKGYFTLGETAEFDITVTNTGNMTLTNVVVTDELAGAVVAQGDGYRANGAEAVIDVLESGAVVLIKATYTVTENDLGQQLANSVTVKGEGPDDPTDPDVNHDPEDATDEEEIPTDEAVTLNGAKTWIDDDNALQTRPESITLRLMADGEAYAETQATAESNWTYTFTGLPMHTAQGEEIVYTLTEDAVPGYDTEYAENSYDVTNTLQNYTLTINYWYDAVGGAVAADTVTRTLAYGEAYDVLSPVLEGCTADLLRVEGVMEGDVEFNVVYTREAFILTINYVFRGGAMAAPSYTATLLFGEAFNQNSPEVAGFVASQRNINGTMAGHNMVYTVIYVPGETTVVINEYGVPLGIGNVEMNVGDCFE